MKILPVGAELLRSGGRADRHDEATVVLRNFAKAPKNVTNTGKLATGLVEQQYENTTGDF